jgi:hypothetical protein
VIVFYAVRARQIRNMRATLNNPVKLKRSKFTIENVAPVAVDIGGSFTKLVYWRPPAPPDLPSYIIKEFQDGEPRLPLTPDPSLKVYLQGTYILEDRFTFFSESKGVLRFLKFPSNRTIEFIQFLSGKFEYL